MFIVFPNHLFEDIDVIRQSQTQDIYIVEEPLYFHDQQIRPVRTNQIKLAYMVASMSWYTQYLKDQLHDKRVMYVPYDAVAQFYQTVKTAPRVSFYDPTDKDVLEKYQRLNPVVELHESLSFLVGTQQLAFFNQKHATGKTVRHASFYTFARSALGVLQGEKNYDEENRKSLPSSYKKRKPPTQMQKDTSPFYERAREYISTHPLFSTFPGSPSLVHTYPITHTASKTTLNVFLKEHLSMFGTYQDAIHKEDPFIHHALISPMLNNGLLSPKYVLQETMKWKQKVSMNNLEGFVRQVIGWREYMRYLYIFHYEQMLAANHFEHKRTFQHWDDWYHGTTGVEPIDQEIKKAVQYGYAHHIVRLMIFLNFFILMEIHPESIYQWFMEVVSIDAYDWVMRSNIYAMGWFYNAAMTKPYLSTSNYIRKMSSYKTGDWCSLWDSLFYRYLRVHKHQFTGSSTRYLQNLKYFEQKSSVDQKYVLTMANNFLDQQTQSIMK